MFVSWLAWLGCQPGVDSFGPPPVCISDAGACLSHSGGAVGGVGVGGATVSSSVGAGGFGAAEATNLTGTVGIITSPTFTGTTPFAGVASVVAPGPGGVSVTEAIGGTSGNGNSFDLMTIASGPQWLMVQNTTAAGGADIFSTYSLVDLPIATPIVLPVVELGLLTQIATSQPTPVSTVSTSASQLVILVTHLGQPYKGVSLNGVAGGATVLYDIGPGAYSDEATATGTGGVIILFNTSLEGGSLIGLLDTNTQAMSSVQVMTAPGVVSLVQAAL
jgi:hypothetical protein